MREESKNSVGLPLVSRVVEKLKKIKKDRRVTLDEIPFEFIQLAGTIHEDMKTQRFGNHFPDEVSYRLPFVGRLGRGDCYDDGTVPILYIESVSVVADEWAARFASFSNKTRMLSEADKNIGDLFISLASYVNKNG